MSGISQSLDSKINGENPVKIGCIVSEKSDQKSVHTLNAYTATFHSFAWFHIHFLLPMSGTQTPTHQEFLNIPVHAMLLSELNNCMV